MNEERSTISFRDTWTAAQEFSFGEVDGKPKGRSNIIKYRQSHLSTFTSWRDKCRIICKLQKRPHIPFQRFDVETHSQACHTATSDSPWYVTSDSIRRCPELVTQGSKDHNGSGMWPEVAKYPRGGPKTTSLDRNYEKKYQKVKRSKNSNHPPEHSRTHTHTTSVLPVMEHRLSSIRSQGHQRLVNLPTLQLLRWLHLLHMTKQKE